MVSGQVSGRRIHAIDFTKGMLVLLMVVYHVLNYLDFGTVPHDYLGFVPASFIMITGFLAFHVYSPRADRASGGVARRLCMRAVKLVLIFTLFNVAARLLLTEAQYGSSLNVHGFFNDWSSIFLTGEASGVAFDVLLPIAYVLVLSAVLLRIPLSRRRVLSGLAIGFFLVCVLLESFGHLTNTLRFISAGLIGVAFATGGLDPVDRRAESRLILACAIATSLSVAALRFDYYAGQILSTIMWLFIFYTLGRRSGSDRWLPQQMAMLGRYSLVAYIVQIIFLQGTSVLLAYGPASAYWRVIVLGCLIALLTWMTICAVEFARPRSRFVDRAYRTLFA